MENKSVFDGVPVNDKAWEFPVISALPAGTTYIPVQHHNLEIVSHCTECGAPIYGRKQIKSNESPEVRYSCYCHAKPKSIQDTMQIK